MRPYPTDSPEAAARIVALVMLADGQLTRRELSALDRLQVHATLGLDRAALRRVIHEVCEDLLDEAHLAWSDTCRVTPRTLGQLMEDIADPALQRTVMSLAVQLAEIDGHVADGEEALLVAAVEHWGLHREMFAPAA
jgi:uncharacterized tellurite resistance protein B-like protein